MFQKELKSTEALKSLSFFMPLQQNMSSGLKNFEFESQDSNKITEIETNAAQSTTAKISSASANTTSFSNSSIFYDMNSENLGTLFKNKIDEINTKREKDSVVTTEFHACINKWASESTNRIIEAMYKKFRGNSLEISSKLELIQKDLESIANLEVELLSISNQVELLFREIKQNA